MKLSAGLHFIIGGARSGKSCYAEQLALNLPSPRLYIATAQILDDEMADRVKLHQKRRGTLWDTKEAPFELLKAIQNSIEKVNVILVDCITMWLTNLLLSHGMDPEKEVENLCDFFKSDCIKPVIVVSNEVGMGVIPENFLARKFVDLAGWANQKLAAVARTATWVVAGIPVAIKNG